MSAYTAQKAPNAGASRKMLAVTEVRTSRP